MLLDQCAVCWKTSGKLCTRCKSCRYCSKECQKSDWKSHKLLCQAIAAEPSRPSRTHIRAIYFPADKVTPELAWIPCFENHEIPEEPNVPHYDAIRDLVVGAHQVPGYEMHRVDFNYRHKKPTTKRAIEFNYRSHFRLDGSPATASLYATVNLHGKVNFAWRGPLLVFGISIEDPPEDSDDPVTRYTDATLADFRSVIDHSLGYDKRHDGDINNQLDAMRDLFPAMK